MSEMAIPAEIASDLAKADRGAYLEQRLFVLSPFGLLATSALVLLLLVGSFALAATIAHVPFLTRTSGGTQVDGHWRSAIVTSLLLATILFAQRYTRIRERADFAAFASVLRGGTAKAVDLAGLTPRGVNLWRPTLIGMMFGCVLEYLFIRGDTVSQFQLGLFLWYSLTLVLLCVLFARGVALTRGAGRTMRRMIDSDLVIDLLRIDRLSVIGRSAARAALVWFLVSAVSCLYFLGGGMDDFTTGLLIACAAMGLWIFVATMERVHRKIRAVKAEELDRLCDQIDDARARAAGDSHAAQHLQSLLAYESRIRAVHEWPFDQTTLVRVLASLFILAVPWFGQAVAAFAVERVAQIVK